MAETTSDTQVNITRLIMIPALITLAVTILRLVGELNHWSDFWFNRSAGGRLAPLGISWLPIIFGVYFALKLSSEGDRPASAGKAILFAILGIAIVVVASIIGFAFISQDPGNPITATLFAVSAIVAVLLQRKPWPTLFKTLFVYALAARIPVAILMLFAIRGSWGTHYDVAPPNFPTDMNWFMKWVLIGALPQFFLWIMFTITVGALFGGIAVALFRRDKKRAQTTATA